MTNSFILPEEFRFELGKLYITPAVEKDIAHSDDRSLIPEDKFAEEVKRNVALVTIPDEWKEKFLAQIELWQNDEAQMRQRHVDRIKAELATLKTKIDRLNIAFTEGGIELAEFKELKNPLIGQKADLEQKLALAEKGQASPIEPVKNLIFEANMAQKWVFENNLLEMKSFLQKVGLNREIRSQTLTVSFKKPFDLLAETTVAAQRAASEAERNSIWWWPLKIARIFFDENPSGSGVMAAVNA